MRKFQAVDEQGEEVGHARANAVNPTMETGLLPVLLRRLQVDPACPRGARLRAALLAVVWILPAPAGEHLLLLQRSTRRLIEPDLSVFPEIEVDRLAALRTAPESEPGESDGADLGLQDDDEPAPRPVRIPFLQWSRNGSELLVQVFSIDNKDRWILDRG